MAINDYSEAIKLNKQFKKAIFSRAIIYSETEQFSLAINDFTSVIN